MSTVSFSMHRWFFVTRKRKHEDEDEDGSEESIRKLSEKENSGYIDKFTVI